MNVKTIRFNLSILIVIASTPLRAQVQESRTIEERYEVDSVSATAIAVENVFGPVRVIGYDGDAIELVATETIHAESQEDLERAREQAHFRTSFADDRFEFVVAPAQDCDCRHRWSWQNYSVSYDIELRVPREASVEASTVNAGDVLIEGVVGIVDARNVNGGVSLYDLRRSASARTVNGPVHAEFAAAPAQAASFATVNGNIDVAFPTDLSADLQLKTMHGGMWTDFDVTGLTSTPARAARPDGRFAIRPDDHTNVRVGRGGPAHRFETLNGEIYVRRAE